MIWFRNFVHTLRRFLLASITNLVGLVVAFGAFYVIMTQVEYDFTYDKGYEDYQNLVRIDIQTKEDITSRQLWICLPLARTIAESSPHITDYSIIQGWTSNTDVWVGDSKMGTANMTCGFDNFLSPFRPKMLVGDTESLNGGKCLIPKSLAERYYGHTDCAGQTLHLGEKNSGRDIEVGGVYEDFAENSTIGNAIFIKYSDEYAKGEDNWQQFNYNLYLRLDDIAVADEVMKTASDYVLKNAPTQITNETTSEYTWIHYTPMSEVHFSNVGGNAQTSHTTLYLLIIISIAIVCVAGINFMNFSLAETPMRIRSINTQKVLGASVAALRESLITESVAVCIVAAILGGVIVMASRNFGLQEIVQGDISFSSHPLLVAVTMAIAIIAGLLAGIYPAIYATSIPPAVALKGDFGLSKSGRTLRTILLALQFIVAFALVVCISIMYAQTRHISSTYYGMDKDYIIMGFTSAQLYDHRDAVRNELLSVTGVENVSFSGFAMGSDTYPHWGRGRDSEHTATFFNLRCDRYFLATMGIKITQGRDFNETDKGAFIFNEAAMDKYDWFKVGEAPWPNNSLTGDNGDDFEWRIVGVCENIRYRSLRYDNNYPMCFCVFPESMDWFMSHYNIRVAHGTDMVDIVSRLHKVLDKYYDDNDAELLFMNDRLNLLYESERRFTSQMLLFSAIAILISLMGVMGISMFEAEYRRKEIAVRKVLGCPTGEVVSMFIRRYLKILGVCFVIGAPLGYALSLHWMAGFADRVEVSPWVFIISLLGVSLLTISTVALQVWSAARANPVESLKR